MCACPVTWTAWQCLRALKARGRVHHIGFIPHLRTHLSCGAGTVARSGCSFTLSHGHIRKRLKRHTNAHFLCPPLSSSAFLSVYLPVLYICHIGIPPMQLVPVPIPRYLSEKCSSKHFTLAYAKGKWQRQVCDRQRTACAQGCHWQNQDHCLPSLLLSHQTTDMRDWKTAFYVTFTLFIIIFREDTGSTGENKALIVM